MSFGGGDAYLTVAEGLFVSTELVTEDAFFGTIIPLVNLLPGSILCKALSGIGYWIGFTESNSILGGYIVAALGFACSFAASCGIVSIVGCLYRGMGELPIFQAMKQWLRPGVSGLMINVILTLLRQCCEIIG
jgi:chromate transporter